MELQEFGIELQKMRKEMGMTQAKLAEALDADPTEISRFEKGHREMGAVLYAKLLKLHDEKMQKKEDHLMRMFLKLSQKKQDAVIQLMTAMMEE